EAVELRDGEATRYEGKGARRAVANVNEQIAPRLRGTPVTEQARVDETLRELDGTPDKSRLGANALLGVSLACAHAAAAAGNVPLWRYLDKDGSARLPLPMVNLISGGLHAGGNLDFQDFLMLPIGATSFSEALLMAVHVYRALGSILLQHGYEGALVGDEGGYGPRLESNEAAIEMILEAVTEAGYTPGTQVALGIDVASTHFYRAHSYHLNATGGMALMDDDMVDLLRRWVQNYPILSIEDGMAEDDWEGWRKLTAALGRRVQLIGDDLFATNPDRLRRGIAAKVGNSILIKLNQIGTLTETLEVLALARSAGYRPIISARSGETEDTTIADLAVATGAGQIKIGSVTRSERLAKYNQLLRIEEALGSGASFATWTDLANELS
ncbi:MAG: phosphopyruvate hydratase, partial [Planctomycetota bacterium]